MAGLKFQSKKSTVVRDEVSVSKKPVEQVREVGGEVRHEELVIDDETKRERLDTSMLKKSRSAVK